MDNGNTPINPLYGKDGLSFKLDEHSYYFLKDRANGLTKREHFAGLAMQGLLSKSEWSSVENCVKYAIEYADELLKELEK